MWPGGADMAGRSDHPRERQPAHQAHYQQNLSPKRQRMYKMRFRIIKDQFNGYEVQYRAWYHMKWQQWSLGYGGVNSYHTLAAAERQVQLLRKLWHKKPLAEVIKYWEE
jgi:hypothetical protein